MGRAQEKIFAQLIPAIVSCIIYQNKIFPGNSTYPSIRKEDNKIPSPSGEGQVITPINHLNQGEVTPISCFICLFVFK